MPGLAGYANNYHQNGMLTLHVFASSMAFFLIILRNRLQVLAPQTC
jgi:hypothetical protein